MKIALVRLSALGDIVHSSIVLQFIKKHYSHAKLHWICEESFAPLLQTSPHLDHVHPVALKKLKKNPSLTQVRQLIGSLPKVDLAIDLQGLIKSALLGLFLAKRRVGPQIGCAREWPAAWFYTDPVVVPCEANVADRSLIPVSKALGFSYSHEEILAKEPCFVPQKRYPHLDRLLGEPTILLVPSSSQPNKNYPPKQFAQVAKALEGQVLISWGNAKEKEIAHQIAQQSGATVLPKLSLDELIYLISKTDLLIGGDTGPSHLAWALNRPSLILFGYTTPNLMVQTPINKAIAAKEVDPCRWDKRDACIKEILPDDIIAQAKKLLERR